MSAMATAAKAAHSTRTRSPGEVGVIPNDGREASRAAAAACKTSWNTRKVSSQPHGTAQMNPLKTGWAKIWEGVDEVFENLKKTIDTSPLSKDGFEETETHTKEVRPDGTTVTTRQVVRKSRVTK